MKDTCGDARLAEINRDGERTHVGRNSHVHDERGNVVFKRQMSKTQEATSASQRQSYGIEMANAACGQRERELGVGNWRERKALTHL